MGTTHDGPTRVPPDAGDTRVVLDGRGLDVPGLVRLADAAAEPVVPPEALDRVRRGRASQGLEEAASFAGQAARRTQHATAAYATVLACELVTAVRALRLSRTPPTVPAFTVAAAALPPDTEDRPLTGDVTTAMELLPALAGL
ncbi:hypothetical protein ACWGI9_31265 [Streptomyces sp. NPDC054833]